MFIKYCTDFMFQEVMVCVTYSSSILSLIIFYFLLGNHLFVLKYLIWLNKNINFFDISFIKGLVKVRFTNEINKRAIADAEISDNRNGPQVGYDQALYPRLHDIFDFLCFLSS